MQKNTVLGFVLIGLVLIGFGWYNSYNYKKQVREAFVRDSLLRVEALSNPHIADSLRVVDSLRGAMVAQKATEVAVTTQSPDIQGVTAAIYTDSLLEVASHGEEQIFTLENSKLKIDFTSRGAQIKRVLIKDYYTYDSSALYLIDNDLSDMSLVFFTKQRLSSSSFNFEAVEKTDTSLLFRLNFEGGASLDYEYTLPKEGYMANFNIVTRKMGEIIPRNVSSFDLDWSVKISRFEKGYDNEKNYSTVNYKYPGDKSVENLGMRKASSEKQIPTKISWFAFRQQFFSAIMVADNNFSGGDLAYEFYSADNQDNLLMNCTAHTKLEYRGGDEVKIPFRFYFGPNLYKELKSYGSDFERIIPLGTGLIGWINRGVIINIFHFLSRFISNYGIIILIMTILLKIVLSPLTFKSYMSSAKMRVLKPELTKIAEKYPKKEDALKKQQETMALYKKTGVSMMGGCLPMLLQIPILWAIFRFFPVSFELRQHPFLWASDLSGYDSILDFGFNIPMYGNHISLFALLMAISMYFYSKINMDQMPDTGQMAGMKGMQLYFMPLFMLVLCNNFSAGLSYYYMLTNIITIAQTFIIRHYFVDEKKLRERLLQKAASAAAAKPKKKSKWKERMEQLIQEQQRQQREKARRK